MSKLTGAMARGAGLLRRSVAAQYSLSHSPTAKLPQIAIIGAGPAGLTLGVLLHQRRIPFTIYEHRCKPSARDYEQPSGMLDLHPDTGLAAIAACGLTAEFQARSGECGEAAIVADQEGAVLWSSEGDGTRPEISRHALTQLLLSKLPGERIKWAHALSHARGDGESGSRAAQHQHQYALQFDARGRAGDPHASSDAEATADLVIGADGAWSRTRSHLLDAHKPAAERAPVYSGVHMITLDIADLAWRRPELDVLVGTGSWIALGDRNAMISQRGSGSSARVYLVISAGEDEVKSAVENLSPAAISELLLNAGSGAPDSWRNFSTWGPKPKALISVALDDLAGTAQVLDVRGMYMRPVDGLAWPHRVGVTLLGDAAHLMTPFAGEGVNLAMRDALDLAGAITRAWDDTIGEDSHDDSHADKGTAFKAALDPLIQDFEKAMIGRAEEAAKETWDNLQAFIGEDAANKVAALYKGWE